MKLLFTLLLAAVALLGVACGDKGNARATSVSSLKTERVHTRIRGVTSYRRTFGDFNDAHLSVAKRKGICPLESRAEADSLKDNLLRIAPNGVFAMDSLTHSIPYLVPSASVLLTKIGQNFQDSLVRKGLSPNRIIVTSVLRTQQDVKKLRRRNVNASLNSAHFFGTTFDVSYRRFEPVDTVFGKEDAGKLKMVLAEVLRDLRKKEWCYVKYEVKQGCFHITTRL